MPVETVLSQLSQSLKTIFEKEIAFVVHKLNNQIRECLNEQIPQDVSSLAKRGSLQTGIYRRHTFFNCIADAFGITRRNQRNGDLALGGIAVDLFQLMKHIMRKRRET